MHIETSYAAVTLISETTGRILMKFDIDNIHQTYRTNLIMVIKGGVRSQLIYELQTDVTFLKNRPSKKTKC
jgi:hypothetical protein